MKIRGIFLFFIAAILFTYFCMGCSSLQGKSNVGEIDVVGQSKIVIFTDGDVNITKDGATSDDTTFIIVGVQSNEGDLTSIFNHAMDQIKGIFEERAKVYQSWINKAKGEIE